MAVSSGCTCGLDLLCDHIGALASLGGSFAISSETILLDLEVLERASVPGSTAFWFLEARLR
jgi:hypothetical protein